MQMAHNATDDSSGHLNKHRYVLHDRDTKFCASYRDTLTSSGVQPLSLPPRSPNLNAFAERWVRSVKHECLGKLILVGERSLQRALTDFIEHYHSQRNHQGKNNVLLFPSPEDPPKRPRIVRLLQRTPRWITQILLLCRQNFLAIRRRPAKGQ